jgi:nucleotide-binding universal stress UspA family protein
MKRALVIVTESEESHSMVRSAGLTAAAHDAPLVLYSEATQDDISEAALVSDLNSEGGVPPEVNASAVDGVRRFLEGVAEDQLADVDVEYETVGSIVPAHGHAESILRVADEYGCDHIFVTGRKRSPTGKAIFGDFIQSLLLKFDGRVTVDLE